MRGTLEGDGGPHGFLALQQQILQAEKIKAKLAEPGEQAFMTHLQSEWREQQSHTERGRTLHSLAAAHTERAQFQQLQQLLPQPAEVAPTGT